MCSPQGIIDQLGGLAFCEAVKAGKYVLHYEKNLEKLQDEIKDLDKRRECIEIEVGEAFGRGKDIMPDVKAWQTKADGMKIDVDKFIKQSTAKGNMHCIAFSCPNIKWRYRLSKQAEQKILDVKAHTEKGHFGKISHHKPTPLELEFLCDENFVNFDSRTPNFDNIVDALKDSSVTMVGVHGLGGVGKTTLVMEVGKKMGREGYFKQVALATIPKGRKVEEVQSQLADRLKFNFDPEKPRNDQLWNKLTNGDKYLIILDDIWEKVDMKAIGIPIKDEKKRCKVLVTSRNRHLLNTMEVQKNFSIAELPEAEAWDLFKKKVGNTFEFQPELIDIGHKVCNKCKGLPVAINAIGDALKDQQDFAWKDALVKLERYELMKIEGIDSSIGASLRLSYNLLGSSNAKSCFLLCCLFREDAEIPIGDLTRQCLARRLLSPNPRTVEEARNSVCTVIDTLKSASLLSNGSHENVVKIHDIIRDVGISIAREKNQFFIEHGAIHWPENGPSYSAISLASEKIEALPTELTCPKLHTLMFENSKLSDLEVPDEFFSGMTQLSVLVLTRIRMRKLPSSLGKLANLRMLYLIECDLSDIDILGDLNKSLEVLSLQGSSIQALPPKIGQLTRLRVLDLENCNELKVIPQGVVSKLTNLEELYFPDTFYEGEDTIDKKHDTGSSNNVNFEELRLSLTKGKLTVLHMCIPDVELLPKEGLKFENLKRYRVLVGSKFIFYEDFLTATDFSAATRVLKYEGISLRNEFIPLVDNAEMLYLGRIKGLKKVLHDSGVRKGFFDLKHLEVISCDDDLEYLLGEPKSSVESHGQNRLQSFNKLTMLRIRTCKLKYLFSPITARGLVHLEQLEVSSCEIMEGIVGFEEQNDINEHVGEVKFDKLKRLELNNLPNLISFYVKKEKTRTTMGSSSAHPLPLFDEKVIFPILERLEIIEMGNLIEIWDKQSIAVLEEQGSFCQLMTMSVVACAQLTNVFPSTMRALLKNLKELQVLDCGNMKGIVEFEGEIDEGLKDVIRFSKLTRLVLADLPSLVSFCTKLGTVGTTHSNATILFNEKVIFPVLEGLDISEMVNLIEIWDKQSIAVLEEQGSFCQLMAMNVKDCAQLTNVFPSKMHSLLKNLKELEVEGCGIMNGIVEFEGEIDEDGLENEICFSKLIELTLDNLPSLVSFCTKLGTVGTSNGNATIRAQPLFNKKVIFPLLDVLSLQNLDNITDIWDKKSVAVVEGQGSFCQLMDLNVHKCAQLTHVFPSKMHALLKNLKDLCVSGCETMNGIVEFEGEIDEDGLENEICFSKLIELTLDNLPSLVSFCTKLGTVGSSNGNATIRAQPLFNKKVIFPVLEGLVIGGMDNLTEIWDRQSIAVLKEQGSFYQLMDVHVSSCAQLSHVFPSKMHALLKNLKELDVRKCGTMKGIVEFEGEIEVCFNQLSTLRLEELPNLVSFCTELRTTGTTNVNATILAQPLFNEKVAFPALEKLYIDKVPNITEIWGKKPLPESEKETQSFCKLRDIFINGCNQLVYVLPCYMLPQLQINLQGLWIWECEEVKVIVSKELKEKEATENEIIVFHQLKNVHLERLPKLKSFYTGTELLFSDKVVFPSLESLYINGLPKIKEIWPYKQPLPEPGKEAESFCKLSYIRAVDCGQLVYVFPFYILRQLQHLEDLRIGDCKKLEVIVSKELKEKEVIHNDIGFPQLKTVYLRQLPNLKRFCSEVQLFFSDKHAFPVLEDITLFDERLEFLRNGTSTKEECGTSGKEGDCGMSGEESDYHEDSSESDYGEEGAMAKKECSTSGKEIETLPKGTSTKEECGTSGKENDDNGEED